MDLATTYVYAPLRNQTIVREKPGPFWGDGLAHLDKIPAWWTPETIDMTPRDRFALAAIYARRRYQDRRSGRPR